MSSKDALPSYHPIYHIVQWTLNYVNDERLLVWVLGQGSILRTYYKAQILQRLEQLSNSDEADKPSEHLNRLWKLFTVEAVIFTLG